MNKSMRGFTLLEILLVVAAIAILAGIVIVAINPAQQLAETRDAQRHSDVETISSAITQYIIKNNASELIESFPSADVGTCDAIYAYQGLRICKEGVSCGGVEIEDFLVPDYVAALPIDPTIDDEEDIGYVIYRLSSNRVTVCAPLTEAEDADISVTR